jgi:hypothetical protein
VESRASPARESAQTGHSPDEIIAQYPNLSLPDVYAALAYYYDNRLAIDRQAEEDERFAEELRQKMGPGPLEAKNGQQRR